MNAKTVIDWSIHDIHIVKVLAYLLLRMEINSA
jgi:hypothetical protein